MKEPKWRKKQRNILLICLSLRKKKVAEREGEKETEKQNLFDLPIHTKRKGITIGIEMIKGCVRELIKKRDYDYKKKIKGLIETERGNDFKGLISSHGGGGGRRRVV